MNHGKSKTISNFAEVACRQNSKAPHDSGIIEVGGICSMSELKGE